MNQWRDQTIENTELILTGKEIEYLGPNLILQRCKVTLQMSARWLTITETRFVDCAIKTKRKLLDYPSWSNAFIDGCSFAGTFSGNDFGRRAGYWPEGGLRNCDFSRAILDQCRLMDCDLSSIRLPLWPGFSVVAPLNGAKGLETVEMSAPLRRWTTSLSRKRPSETTAIVYHAPTLAKLYGFSEDELRRVLGNMSGIIL